MMNNVTLVGLSRGDHPGSAPVTAWHQNSEHDTRTVNMTPEQWTWHQNSEHDTRTVGMTPEQWTWHQNSEHDTRTVNMTPEQWTWHQNSEHDTRTVNMTPEQWTWHQNQCECHTGKQWRSKGGGPGRYLLGGLHFVD